MSTPFVHNRVRVQSRWDRGVTSNWGSVARFLLGHLKNNEIKAIMCLKRIKIVIFVLSAQSDCFLLGHENEFLVETVRSRLQTHSNAPTKQSSCARNTNTIFSTTAF
jgi:hypothetical protein